MTGRDRHSTLRIFAALLLPFAACAVQWLFWDTIKPFVWFLFFPTIFFSSRLGGMSAGIAATAVSSGLAWYFFIPPQLSFRIENPNNLYSVAVFMIMGVLFSLTHEQLKRANRRAEAALAIANAKKTEADVGRDSAVTDRNRAEWRLRRLAEVVALIAAVRDLSGLMAIVRRAARELTGADGATLVLREGDRCHYADEDAIGPLWKGQRFPLVSCISGWAMLHAEQVAIEDIYADERIPHAAYRPTFVKSLSMVPINREQPVGAIGCYWQEHHRATEEELGLQQALADAMAVGLANLELIGQLKTAREKAEEDARQIALLNAGLERRVEERTAELTAANRELDAFAYAVSHDLRAPLRALSGFSRALEEDYGSELTDEAREFLGEIVSASRRMGELIDGILALSRTTRSELQRDTVDLSEMAERIRGELYRSEPDRRVEWRIEAGLLAHGDARMLEAALRNLLGNAWKYTAGRTEAVIRLYAEESEDGRRFCIADNGAGFDMSHAEKLFTPFQRLHRQDEFPGIGIGLATVQRIVQRHGGEIQAVGMPGRGATFSFTLPEGAGGRST